MSLSVVSNSREEIVARKAAGALTWSGPALMLFARSVCSVLAQALVASFFVLQSSPTPWHDTARWFPVYATLIDVGCLALLWWLTRREGIALFDLISFDRTRWRADFLLGLGIVPVGLLVIVASIVLSSVLIFGAPQPPPLYESLPLLPALYAVLVFPLIWGITEQMTYNGYLLPRLQVLSGSTGLAVAIVSFAWSFQHVAQPLTFDSRFMLLRCLSPVPFTALISLVYLRVRRLLPFITAHWLMDGLGEFVGVLLPRF